MARKNNADYWETEEGLKLLAGWARNGLTDEQIAKNCGVARSTLNRWKKANATIRDALKQAKAVADIEVENALYKRATGYTVTEKTMYRDKESGEMVVVKEVVKEVAPDTTAMIYWLKNRKPDVWKDRPTGTSESTESQVASFLDALNDALTGGGGNGP